VKPWTNPQTVAVLWLLVGVLLVGWLAGLVSEHETRLQWSHVEPVPKPRPHRHCFGRAAGAWCQ